MATKTKKTARESLAEKRAILYELDELFDRIDSSEEYNSRELAEQKNIYADWIKNNPDVDVEEDWAAKNYRANIMNYAARLSALATIRALLETLI